MAAHLVKRTVIIVLALVGTAACRLKHDVKTTVTYVAGQTVYLGAGRLAGVAPGDTGAIYSHDEKIGTIAVVAVADSSSASNVVIQFKQLSIGDTVVVRVLQDRVNPQVISSEAVAHLSAPPGDLLRSPSTPRTNLVSGRVALQYNAVFAEDPKLNLNQPAAVLQMRVGNLFGANMALDIYGISYLNTNGVYSLFGNRSGLENNLYRLSLKGEVPGSSFGYGLGRMNSGFVSGLGTFDGGEAFYKLDDFTIGAIGGGQSIVPASTLGYVGTKTAGFVNYHSGSDILHEYDGTVAYAIRTVGGKLDRNYLYLQNSLSLGPGLNFFETSEFDVSKLSNGAPKPGFGFANTFVSLNYFPENRLFINAGYDAYRNEYLFQTMKGIPDSLIDLNILQDLRASVSAYLPESITLSVSGSYFTRKDFVRSEHMVGSSVRAGDLLGTGIGAGIRYENMVWQYSNVNDLRLELDRTFFSVLDLTVSYESYEMSVSLLQQTYTTQTISGYLDCEFSRKWYSSFGVDDIIDPSMNSIQGYAEIGFRF